MDRDAWLSASLPEGTPIPGEAHRLSRKEARRKLRALREYRTQWPGLDVGRMISRRQTIRYEVSFATGPWPDQ